MGVLKLAHGVLKVNDLPQSLEFYREVVGLHEIGKQNGIVYLGCGADNNYDLALTEGGSGISILHCRCIRKMTWLTLRKN